MQVTVESKLKVADEVWIATALLHRENPRQADFAVREIVARAEAERGRERLRPGVYVHVVQHCVANRAPDPGRYRILLETGRNRRRLFRPGDWYNPQREGAKIVPEKTEIPEKYHELLEWYENEYKRKGSNSKEEDPLLSLRGSGKKLWADEHADAYVQRLREAWE
jgi:hypothetical protein